MNNFDKQIIGSLAGKMELNRSIPETYSLCQMLTDSFSIDSERETFTSFADFVLATDGLCRQYIWRAFEELGWNHSDHVSINTEDLMNTLDIHNDYQRLVNRLLEIIAQRQDRRWLLRKSQERMNVAAAMSEAKKTFPFSVVELEILEKTGTHLARVLGGMMDPLQLIFSDNAGPTADYLYWGTGMSKLLNTSLRDVVRMIVEGFPSGQDIKILEIGAGTGGTTREIVPVLSNRVVEYSFTDISGTLVEIAKNRFKDYKMLSFQKLDIERSSNEQGYQMHEFSVIIAANVLHATEDMPMALAHVRQLLAPGGILVLLEGTRKQAWLDLIFGLLPGWWRFQDSVRDNYPLISTDQWLSVLRASGFSAPVAFVPHIELGQSIIMATTPE